MVAVVDPEVVAEGMPTNYLPCVWAPARAAQLGTGSASRCWEPDTSCGFPATPRPFVVFMVPALLPCRLPLVVGTQGSGLGETLASSSFNFFIVLKAIA